MSETLGCGELAAPRAANTESSFAGEASSAWDVSMRRLWKTFGPLAALRGVTLRVAPRERLAIVGPNGSGKSTLLRVLATLLRPSSGTALVGGLDVRRDAAQVRRYIGVLTHHTFLYRDLTCRENLEFYARLYRLANPSERALWQLRLVGLEKQRDTLARDLSRGMQQRLALARAFLHDPPVLLLDEPDTGLDQRWCAFLTELLDRAALEGRTIVLTTHNLERSLDLSERVVVLNAGKVVFSARRNDLDVETLRENYARCTSVTL